MTLYIKSFVTFLLTGLLFANHLSAQTGNLFQGEGAGISVTISDFNTAFGDSALSSLTIGSSSLISGANTAIGFGAAKNNTTTELTAIGAFAGYFNTTGFDNTFIGKDAGRLNTGAGDNTFIGVESGENNTDGYDNTFVGEESGTLNTSGFENTFIGEDAGFNNTTGYQNVFVGNEAGLNAGVGYKNVGVGSDALSDMDDGYRNTAVGDSAGADIGDGTFNTLIGTQAGVATEWADYNTFIGALAGWDNNRTNGQSNANRNTYVGFRTGYTNREGEDNVGMGAYSDFDNTQRYRCTFLGAASTISNNDVISIGFQNLVDGSFSVSIGEFMDTRATGAIAMGYQTRMPNTATNAIGIGRNTLVEGANSISIGAHDTVTGSNSILIGYDYNLTADNEVFVGNAITANIGGSVNWTAMSDGRFKTAVKEDIPGLDFINSLRPVSYQFDLNQMHHFNGNDSLSEELEEGLASKSETRFTGFIAQEVEKAAQNLGYDFSGVKVPEDASSQAYGIRYAEFVVPLTKAVQELNRKVEEQQQIMLSQTEQLEKYQKNAEQTQKMMSELSARLDALEQSQIYPTISIRD
ncbi:MAG: tail fiber domain-containing protein [Bacteroidota bacterium]